MFTDAYQRSVQPLTGADRDVLARMQDVLESVNEEPDFMRAHFEPPHAGFISILVRMKQAGKEDYNTCVDVTVFRGKTPGGSEMILVSRNGTDPVICDINQEPGRLALADEIINAASKNKDAYNRQQAAHAAALSSFEPPQRFN